jgi:hypothetical protein
MQSLFLRVKSTHHAKAGSLSIPRATDHSATSIGLDYLTSVSLSQLVEPSFHRTQSCHSLLGVFLHVLLAVDNDVAIRALNCMFIQLMIDKKFHPLVLVAVNVALGPHGCCNHICRMFGFHAILELENAKPGVQDWTEVCRSDGITKIVKFPSLDASSRELM